MQYIRPFDADAAVDTGYPGYRAQFLSHLESAIMIASHIEEGGCGPELHYHHSDQLYFLLRGAMKVRLGEEVHAITAGTLVFIPAGLAHCNWNEGPGTETHFEMIIPAPTPGAPIAHFVDSPDDVPAERRSDRRGYVRAIDPARFTEPLPGFTILPLADPSSGSVNTVVNYAEVGPGKSGPGTHVHEFDQYYLVLEGTLTIEVALERHVVGPENLVLLPAGVPHRQYNAGDVVEKHLAILAPTPEEGRSWDFGVTFETNGDDHSGNLAAAGAPDEHAAGIR
jgi:mannose-6-phosphate isomerase-like protein (cupin superfamily)